MSVWRCEREERAASVLVTAGVTFPCTSACAICARAGSQFEIGTSWVRIPTRPVLGTLFGSSAWPRFVQEIAGTIALKGTPAAVAFQTSPPPSESPSAPISVSETSLRAASQVKRSCASCTSLGPSSPNLPPDAPVPRASQASAAKPAGASALPRSAPCPCGTAASPWKRITPGQPPVGAVPLGRM